ncbi:MAG: P-loop NTPase [Planctomycetota bacterium]
MTQLSSRASRSSAKRAERDDQATRLRRMLDQASTPGQFDAEPPPPDLHAPPIITVASGKGGVGKSILALSLALSIARTKRVTLLDADFGAANADVLLGLAPLRRLDECFLTRFAPGRRPADIAIDVAERLRLVPGIVGGRHLPHASERRRLITRLVDFHTTADAMILDAAAGVHPAVIDMLAAADCPVIVTTPEPTAAADAYALLKSLAKTALPAACRACIAVNLADDRAQAEHVYRRLAAVSERFLGFRPTLAGIVPRDPRISKAVRAQQVATLRQRPKLRKAVSGIATGVLSFATQAHALRTAAR